MNLWRLVLEWQVSIVRLTLAGLAYSVTQHFQSEVIILIGSKMWSSHGSLYNIAR
jgi:hypothetical protein